MISDLLVFCDSFSVTCALSAGDSLYESVTSTKHPHGSNSKRMKSSQPLCWDAFAPLCWLAYRSHSVLFLLCSCTPSFLPYSIFSQFVCFLCCNLSNIFSAACHISLPSVLSGSFAVNAQC